MPLRKPNILTIPASFSRFASWHGRAAPAAEPLVIHHTSGGHT